MLLLRPVYFGAEKCTCDGEHDALSRMLKKSPGAAKAAPGVGRY